MNPLYQLKSVLCDPEGKCCISGSDEDRAIIDRALKALAEPAVEHQVMIDALNAWANDIERGFQDCISVASLREIAQALAETAPDWLPMCTAPKDGTIVLLLVDFDTHATADGLGPHMTIGSNTSENDKGPDEWQFAGWDWSFDAYTQATGTPVGWLPMPGHAAPVCEPAPEPVAEVVDYILQDDIHNRLTPRVVDIAYSAFVLGSSGTRSDDDGPCDWFNDTKPMVMKQIAKIKKDLAEAAAPVREPSPPPPANVPRISKEHCSLAERKKHQFSVNFPSDDLYCPRCLCSERFLQSKQCEPHIVYDAPSLPSPPSPPPANVPLLTQDDIVQIILSSKHLPLGDAIRLTEKVVRQKAGLK